MLAGKNLGQERLPSVPVDLIRTVAIVGVILLHASHDLTVEQMNFLEIFRWPTVDFYQSIGRIGIPLFIMLTGALLLQPEKQNESLSVFFKKRWARIGLPFIFWGTAYFAWDFLVEHQAFTLSAIINGILNGPYYQFWYLYMLVGLYLLTPIMRIVVAQGGTYILKYFVILWILGASIVPTIEFFFTYSLNSNVFEFTGYVGYFILGAYLLTVRMRRSTISILMTLGIALTVFATYMMAWYVGGSKTYYFHEYFSPTLILASTMTFLLLITFLLPSHSNTGNSRLRGNKLLSLISQNTLPIYLFHPMVIYALQRGFFGFAINGNTINSIPGVPLMTVIVLFICLGVIIVLKKVPVLRRLIG